MKKLWLWEWVGGGYGYCEAVDRDAALAEAKKRAAWRADLKVDEATLRETDKAEVEARWKGWLAANWK